jgi:serine/threonine protein kinase
MNIVKEEHIGEGSYGDVYIIVDKNNGNHKSALKVMKNEKKTFDIPDTNLREIMNTQHLVHPDIIAVSPIVYNDGSEHSVYVDKKRLELCLELMDGDLYSMTDDQLTVDVLRKMIYTVTRGLYHMHSMGYTHNDLKPDNIFYKLENGNYIFKLGDFGMSQYLGIPFPSGVEHFFSTPSLKAPNSKKNSHYVEDNKYNYNTDMFSLGATMFWTCMKRHSVLWHEFRDSGNDEFVNIEKKNFLDQVPRLKEMYGDDGCDFIIKCMAVKSSERMSSKKALEHPYLRPLRGGHLGILLNTVKQLYKQPTIDSITSGNYEFEFIDDMYNCYKDRRINLYVDSTKITPGMIIGGNDWTFKIFEGFIKSGMLTLETYLQYQLILLELLNNTHITDRDLQLYCITLLRLCDKLYSTFENSSLIDLSAYTKASENMITKEQLVELEKEILNVFGGKVPFTPITFFLNYWYIKSCRGRALNVNVLNTSIAAMLAIMACNSREELKDVKIDDLSKYCVNKALVLEKSTGNANLDILSVPTTLTTMLDECIVQLCAKDLSNTELYIDVKQLLPWSAKGI